MHWSALAPYLANRLQLQRTLDPINRPQLQGFHLAATLQNMEIGDWSRARWEIEIGCCACACHG
jgi:hypothetical protein